MPTSRLFLVMLAVLSFSGMTVTAAGLWLAHKYYLERATLRLNPVNTQRYSRANWELGSPIRPRWVIIGDSRVDGWDPGPRLVGAEIVWRGMPAETTAQMLYRFQSDAIALEPAAIVIQSGINDLVSGVALNDAEMVVDRTVSNLAYMATMAANAGREVYLLTVVRPARPPLWRLPVWSDSIYDHVAEVNEGLRAIQIEGVHIVDADRALSGNSRVLPAEFSIDTLHLSASAYEVLNKELIKAQGALPHAVQ